MPTQLVFDTQPSTTGRAANALATQPRVKLLDAQNALVDCTSASVTLSAYSDSGCTTPVGSGNLLASAATSSSGVAAFSGVTFDRAASIYLKASAGSLQSACSTKTTLDRRLKNLAIYYAYPSSTNFPTLAWNNTDIGNFYAKYDTIVFGDGIEAAAHPDHANTIAIITTIHATPGREVFGYVPLGNSQSLSLAQIQTNVDDWATMGVDGIFVDEFGFDFWNSDADMRTRQKTVVDYIHGKGLRVFVNAWEPNDVFTKVPGTPLTFLAGDYYLHESYILTSAASQVTYADYRSKVAKLKTAMASSPIQVMGINTTTAASTAFVPSDFEFLQLSAVLDGYAGVGWGTLNFSASGADANLLPFRAVDENLTRFLLSGSITAAAGTTTTSSAYSNSSGGTISLQYTAPVAYTIQ